MAYVVSGTDLTNIANAIRTKGGTSESLRFPDGFVSAVQNIPSGGGTTLITKKITENGIYNASGDSADGYSSVEVNVPVPPVINGTFTPSASEEGSVKSISVPYSGSGFPVALLIYPSVGAYKSGSDIYASTHNKGIVMFALTKANMADAPLFDTQNIEKNQASVVATYKNSSSDSTNLSSSMGKNRPAMTSYNPNGNVVVDTARFTGNTSLKVYISDANSNGYGFISGIEYAYHIIYSS